MKARSNKGGSKSFRLCLDVDIGKLGIVLVPMPKPRDIDIEIECQYLCLDV